MSFDEAYNYLLSLSNLPRQEYMSDPEHCIVYLQRVQFLLDILGNPEKRIPHYVHVTGTSGKGSVCFLLQSILSASGKKTGTLISPHPTRITERWLIDGKEMPQTTFVSLVETLKEALEVYQKTSPYEILSFFEFTTVMGILYFAHEHVTYAVLEVGCGGRFDSTNVIPHKDVAIITNIGLDHTHLLGDTKEKIAFEKSGIIKPGCAVFTAEEDPSALSVIEDACTSSDTTLTRVGKKTHPPHTLTQSVSGLSFLYDNHEYTIPALGEHQAHNAILAIEVARSLGINEQRIVDGLSQVILPIRMEVVSRDPVVMLDSAHNADKISTTAQTLLDIHHDGDIHLLLGFSENKDIETMLASFVPLHPTHITCTRNTMNHFRKVMHPKELADRCRALFPEATVSSFLDPTRALTHAKNNTQKRDILLITGSVFVAGEIRGMWYDDDMS